VGFICAIELSMKVVTNCCASFFIRFVRGVYGLNVCIILCFRACNLASELCDIFVSLCY
jgi:hypothetical protein